MKDYFCAVSVVSHIDRDNKFCDSVWCMVTCNKNLPILIGCIYRSPSSSRTSDDNLNSLLSNMCESYSKCIIVGDFNYPKIDWDLYSGSSDAVLFLDTLNDCSLTQMVDCPTRGEAILDLVLTNDPSLFLSVDIEEPLLGCDHKSIHCKLAVDLSPKFSSATQNKLFDFSKADWDLFSKTIDSANLSSLLDVDDSELNWLHFKAEVFSAAHLAIPVKSKVKFFRGVPLLRDVKRAVHARKKTYRRYSRIHDSYANEKRLQADDRLREAIEAANAKYEKDLAIKCKKDPKAFWETSAFFFRL